MKMNYQLNDLMERELITSAQTSKGPVFDVDEVLSFAKKSAWELEPNLEIDEIFEEALYKLALYFANDKRFESEGYGKLTKGLYILGPTGSGKTLLMRSFKNNPFGQINTIGTNKIVDAYMKGGIEAIEIYQTNNHSRRMGYCFDDLGAENPAVKYMGSECNCMMQILLARYEERIPFHLSHITSNISGEQVGQIYGQRVRSRVNEMFNLIKLLGADRRLSK